MYGGSEATQKLMERFRNQRFRLRAEDEAGGYGGGAAGADLAAGVLSCRAANERCGDSVELIARLSPGPNETRIEGLSHRTVGCSICQVSADFLCEAGRGLTLPELAELGGRVRQWLRGDAEEAAAAGSAAADRAAVVAKADDQAPVAGLELLSELRGTRARARCVLLGWEAAERLAQQAEV